MGVAIGSSQVTYLSTTAPASELEVSFCEISVAGTGPGGLDDSTRISGRWAVRLENRDRRPGFSIPLPHLPGLPGHLSA